MGNAHYWYWDTPKTICSRCLFDETTPNISFDENGVCSYCHDIDLMDNSYPTGKEGQEKLQDIIDKIKHDGVNKKYDCVIGVSGGCDSSYMLYKMKEMGLRPLAAHFDNTWNSAIATSNISKILKALDIDLFTHVIHNEEYDDIYKSFLSAGVPDLEAITDIGLATTLYLAAEKYGIKYMIEGHSFRTEGVSPLGWNYMDGKYIYSVHKKFGSLKMKTYPNLWFRKFIKWMLFSRIKKIRPLYYLDYDKEKAKRLLKELFNWTWYGGHHLENRCTAFYHTYFMPERYKIDQRLNGYCALVRSGQMSREEGLMLMSTKPEVDHELIDYVKRRLNYSDKEFEIIMNLPKKTFVDFKTYKPLFEKLRWFFYLMYKADLVPFSFYNKYTSKKFTPNLKFLE